ncbi:hypothetical protein WAI453_007903 [Rhynchosporium graminicola]
MLLLCLFAALLLVSLSPIVQGVSIIHVDITTLVTVASYQPTAKEYARSIILSQPLLSISDSSSIGPALKLTRCNADNCLRALSRYNAHDFCSTYTNSICSDTSNLPIYALSCTGSAIARVSSACTCLNGASDFSSIGKIKFITLADYFSFPPRTLNFTISVKAARCAILHDLL